MVASETMSWTRAAGGGPKAMNVGSLGIPPADQQVAGHVGPQLGDGPGVPTVAEPSGDSVDPALGGGQAWPGAADHQHPRAVVVGRTGQAAAFEGLLVAAFGLPDQPVVQHQLLVQPGVERGLGDRGHARQGDPIGAGQGPQDPGRYCFGGEPIEVSGGLDQRRRPGQGDPPQPHQPNHRLDPIAFTGGEPHPALAGVDRQAGRDLDLSGRRGRTMAQEPSGPVRIGSLGLQMSKAGFELADHRGSRVQGNRVGPRLEPLHRLDHSHCLFAADRGQPARADGTQHQRQLIHDLLGHTRQGGGQGRRLSTGQREIGRAARSLLPSCPPLIDLMFERMSCISA